MCSIYGSFMLTGWPEKLFSALGPFGGGNFFIENVGGVPLY